MIQNMKMWTLKSDKFFLLGLFALFLLVVLFAACQNDGMSSDEEPGEGSVAVSLQGSSAETRAITSTITEEEANLFLVTLFKGTDFVSQQVMLRNFASLTFPVGYGYKVSVENITEEEAESLNEGWGAKRYTGLSAAFGILAGQTTRVAVRCGVANAAVAITIADGVEGCVIRVISGDRVLSTSDTQTAYFNIPPSGTLSTVIQVEKDGEVVSEKEMELAASQVKDINVKPGGIEEGGTLSLEITYDDSFEVVETVIPIFPDSED